MSWAPLQTPTDGDGEKWKINAVPPARQLNVWDEESERSQNVPGGTNRTLEEAGCCIGRRRWVVNVIMSQQQEGRSVYELVRNDNDNDSVYSYSRQKGVSRHNAMRMISISSETCEWHYVDWVAPDWDHSIRNCKKPVMYQCFALASPLK